MTGINPALIDVVFPVHDGYPANKAAGDTRDVMWDMCGAASTAFPEHLWCEPREWKALADENTANKTWPVNFVDRFTNQEPTHECTCHCYRTCFEGTRNAQRAIGLGPPVAGQRLPISAKSASVWISCLSVYAEANPNEWGGAGVRQVLNIAVKRGALPDLIQPRDWGFKHALAGTKGGGNINQSSTKKWIPLDEFPEGWKETAKHFRPLEIIFPETWEQTVCLVLKGCRFVGVGRSGHSIPYGRWLPDEQLMEYVDSYNIMRYDSISKIKATVGGSYCIWSVTAPDDWEHPAG
jgi:hypothetical protein